MRPVAERRPSEQPMAGPKSRQPIAKTKELVAMLARGQPPPPDAFGARLARSYQLLASDEDALEAAKAVVQVLPCFEAGTTELRANAGSVLARAATRRLHERVPSVSGTPLTLQIRLDGDAVDVAAWSTDSATLDEVLAAREELAQALARRGLRLRRFGAAEVTPAEDPPQESRLFDDPLYRRSYVEVIA